MKISHTTKDNIVHTFDYKKEYLITEKVEVSRFISDSCTAPLIESVCTEIILCPICDKKIVIKSFTSVS